MQIRNTIHQFGVVSKLLHWIMAILLTGIFILGLYMTSLDYYDPLYHKAPWWHKSFALLTLLLLLVRFVWKFSHPRPIALDTHKQWEVSLAHIIQTSFYGLIVLIGISGYLISTAKGKGVEFFTLFEIPSVTAGLDEKLADLIGYAHLVLAVTLAVLVALHATAALKHHFIDKDNTLKRMLNN